MKLKIVRGNFKYKGYGESQQCIFSKNRVEREGIKPLFIFYYDKREDRKESLKEIHLFKEMLLRIGEIN